MGLKRGAIAALLFVLCAAVAQAETAVPAEAGVQIWAPAQISALRQSLRDAEGDALPVLDTGELDRAQAALDQPAIDRAATAIALQLARMHLLGCSSLARRAGWRISDAQDAVGLEARLAAAVAANDVGRFLAGLKPRHPDYAVLRAAFATETDAAKKATLSRNMERWRWMPLELGKTYVLVNAASFEVGLWHDGARAGSWPVIAGKPRTPTPVFAATITGITFNPWWEIPASIVRESVGSLVRRDPALARKRGYVWGDGRYRQQPGPGNALGQMKLIMPNAYNVYLHDTPNKQLFTRPVRAFSHGCVRVGDAMGFASTLAEGAKTRAEVDAIVASGETTQVSLAAPLPIYVTYFTAATNDNGKLVFPPDIYGRDKAPGMAGDNWQGCGSMPMAAGLPSAGEPPRADQAISR